MANGNFEKLMEPAYIGKLKLRNRIIKTANGTSFVEPTGFISDRMIAYYENLAKGGVGSADCGVLRRGISAGRPASAGPTASG